MYQHYITIDAENRIIDAFTTAQKQPEEGDIYLHDGGEIVEIFPRRPGLALSIPVEGTHIWIFAYENGEPRWRTEAELKADMPPLPYTPTVEERLDTAEYNVETLNRVLIIMMGGDPDE